MQRAKTWCDHKQHDRCRNEVCPCSCHVAPSREQAAILAALAEAGHLTVEPLGAGLMYLGYVSE